MVQMTRVSMKGSDEGHDPFRDRLVGLGGGVGDGRRALAGLVGEEPALDAPEHRRHEDTGAGPGDARRGLEGLRHHQLQAGEQLGRVQDQDHHGAEHVDGGHERRQDGGHPPDSG